MTNKQKLFVEEYLVDLNATQAAIRAGYSAKTAYSQGQRLLKNDEVQARIAELQAERASRTEVTMDRVVLELSRIAFSDARKVFRWGPDGVTLIDSDDLSDDDAATIAEVSETTSESGGTIRGKRYDKVKALELLGRHLGMFTDNVKLDVNITAEDIIREVKRRNGNSQ